MCFAIIFTIWSRGDEKYEYMYAQEFIGRVGLSPIFTIGKNPLQKKDAWESMEALKEAFEQARPLLEEVKDINVAEELATFQEEAFKETIQTCHEKRGNLYCKYVANNIMKKINSTQNKEWLAAMTDLLEGEIKSLRKGHLFAVLFWANDGEISDSKTERIYNEYLQQHEKNQQLMQKAEDLFPFAKVMRKYGPKDKNEKKETASWKDTIMSVFINLGAIFCVFVFIFICQIIVIVYNKRKLNRAIEHGDLDKMQEAIRDMNQYAPDIMKHDD